MMEMKNGLRFQFKLMKCICKIGKLSNQGIAGEYKPWFSELWEMLTKSKMLSNHVVIVSKCGQGQGKNVAYNWKIRI